jgi:hypothetical protein
MKLGLQAGWLVGATLFVGVFGEVSVANAGAFRPATTSEIEAHVAKSSNLTTLSDGWQYNSNNQYGYKFSDGKMCVRTRKLTVSCTKIITNGTKFYMLSPDGNRTSFN